MFWDGDAAHSVIDLPMLPGAGGALGNAINDTGAVAGYSYFPFGHSHPTLWDGAAPHAALDLGLLPGMSDGTANAINAAGQVVGQCGNTGADSRAFVYSGGTLQDLNDLLDASGTGWVLSSAAAINDQGQIAGWGVHDGAGRAFLLTPAAPTAVGPARAFAARSELRGNAPNPFNPRTVVRFDVGQAGHVRVAVFDARGRLVATLTDAAVAAGSHELAWDGRDLRGTPAASGVYRVRLTAADGVDERAITLAK